MSQSFELRREAHAIAEFHASVQLFQPVSSTAFARVTERLKTLAVDLNLPAAIPIQVFQLAFAKSSMMPPPIGGAGYQRFAETGEIAAALLCDSNSITFTLRDYTGWQQVYHLITSTLSSLLREYMSEVPAVTSIRLQYLNEFKAKDATTKCSNEVFRENNQWLAPAIDNNHGDWHCNVGRYFSVDAERRDLVNVNSSSTSRSLTPDGEARTYVSVMIMAGCFFNIPAQSPLILEPDRVDEQVSHILEEAHKLEKRVLSETLSDTYLSAIGVNNDN